MTQNNDAEFAAPPAVSDPATPPCGCRRRYDAMSLRARYPVLALGALLVLSGCSFKRIALDEIGDMLSAGDSVYTADDDIVLVGGALPFSLKLVESLLAESPDHVGLLLTACRGFVLYSYAYVDLEAERRVSDDLDSANELRARARRLYLRGHAYGVRALEQGYPGFAATLAKNPPGAAAMVTAQNVERDVEALYCVAASLALAISASRTDVAMLARLEEVEVLIDWALALDESWNDGALHELAIQWAAARRGAPDVDAVRGHFERALELSRGSRAGVYVAYAEAVALPAQKRAEFEALLEQALAVDAFADPDNRLLNRVAQRRARWLLQRADELFL